MQSHARQIGHSGEFWQNVVHWRREWQTTPIFLPWEPHDSMKRQKDMTPKDEPPRLEGVQYATAEEQRAITNCSRQNAAAGTKWKWHSGVDVSGGESKFWCYKEQYCIGTWNVRSMNQGKLNVVRQEMVRVNINILGISELKRTGMGEFNSDDHYIYYCERESLRRNGAAFIVNKRVQNAVLGCNLKTNRIVLVHFQGEPFKITVIWVYAPTTDAE